MRPWPPAPTEERTYRIGGGAFAASLVVTIVGVPACLYCERPVDRVSCDGPLVCVNCDMGVNEEGTKWTASESTARRANFQRRIAEYRAAQRTTG